jgi:hypothetical protein
MQSVGKAEFLKKFFLFQAFLKGYLWDFPHCLQKTSESSIFCPQQKHFFDISKPLTKLKKQ